jgi:hypothetical protein
MPPEALLAVGWIGRLCGRLSDRVPSGKYQNRRMAFQRLGKNLCALDTQAHAAVLDRGDGGLRNAGEIGKLILTQLLKLANDSHRFADRYVNPLLGGTKLFISGSRGR